jgi:hypothetical protein
MVSDRDHSTKAISSSRSNAGDNFPPEFKRRNQKLKETHLGLTVLGGTLRVCKYSRSLGAFGSTVVRIWTHGAGGAGNLSSVTSDLRINMLIMSDQRMVNFSGRRGVRGLGGQQVVS